MPADFADVSADIEAQIDDNNLLHTSIGGISGGDVTIGDAYLQTDWGFFTTKLGNTAFDSYGYAISNKEYESKTKGAGGPGVSIEVPIGNFTVGAGKFFDSPYAIGIKYSNGLLDTVGFYYAADVLYPGEVVHAIAGSLKIVAEGLSIGAGIRWDDGLTAGGVGAKYDFGIPHIATGVGTEETIEGVETKFGADAGLTFDLWGTDIAVSYFKEIDEVNISAWVKPGVVKLKLGYDIKPLDIDEVYIEVSADF